MIIVVLEWNSTSGQTPIVIVTDDLVSGRKAAFNAISAHLPIAAGQPIPPDAYDGKGSINDIDRDWVAAHPVPDDPDDDAAVTAWLDTFREATTDLWLSLYQDVAGAEDRFRDLRTSK